MKKSMIFAILISLAIPAFSNFSDGRYISSPSDNWSLSNYPVKKKTAKVKKPQSAKKAQKKQEKKDKKKDKDYEKFVRDNQKHSMEIQTPAVRDRMKQNIKDSNANYKAKKKSNAARTKRGAKKYGR